MGDPKKIRKKYETPVHPWQKARIVEEVKLLKEYGLKNKKEIWKFSSLLKKYKDQAKKLIAMQGKQADLERKQMMDKLKKLGLIKPGNETYDAIFSLGLSDVLSRMLQTVVYKKGLARSIKQARQFIVHNHILIGDKKITSPRYLVNVSEESKISFDVSSSLYNPEHPERKTDKIINEQKTKKTKQESKEETKQETTKTQETKKEVKEDVKNDENETKQ